LEENKIAISLHAGDSTASGWLLTKRDMVNAEWVDEWERLKPLMAEKG
jgi:hypothetical protein